MFDRAADSIDANRLKEVFGIDTISDRYIEYTPLKGTQAGFSVKREYPAKLRYKPFRTRDGKIDTLALIRVRLLFPSRQDTEPTSSGSKIPIFLDIGIFSRYLSEHYDYDFNEPSCPTEESVKVSKSTPKPIALDSLDEYVYDSEAGALQKASGEPMSGEEILDELFQKHIDTVHVVKGLGIRWKIGSRNVGVKLINSAVQVCKWLLNSLFGRTLESGLDFRGALYPYKREDMKLLSTETIDLFGYKASKGVIVTVCAVMIALYVMASIYHIEIISDLIANQIIAVCLTIFALWFFDRPFPVIILLFINCLINVKRKIMFIGFRV